MNNPDNNPRLRRSLRQSYRSVRVSPFLSQRVIASVENNKRQILPYLKLAGAVVSMVFLAFVLLLSNDTGEPGSSAITPSTRSALQLPSIPVPALSARQADVPGLSSLGDMPTLNRIHTPAVSLVDPGDFCLYQPTGELLC